MPSIEEENARAQANAPTDALGGAAAADAGVAPSTNAGSESGNRKQEVDAGTKAKKGEKSSGGSNTSTSGSVDGPTGDELAEALAAAGLPDEGTADEKRQALKDSGYNHEGVKQARKDAEWRAEHPGEVLIREANAEAGGESFGYAMPPGRR